MTAPGVPTVEYLRSMWSSAVCVLNQFRERVQVPLYLAPSGRTLLISDVLDVSPLRSHTPSAASASCVMDFSPSPSAPVPGGLPRHEPYRPRLIAYNSS